MKAWQPINDQCMHCGADAAVFTDAEDGLAFDGDAVICLGCLCHGSMVVDAETAAYVAWHDERPGTCGCTWCNRQAELEEVRRAGK